MEQTDMTCVPTVRAISHTCPTSKKKKRTSEHLNNWRMLIHLHEAVVDSKINRRDGLLYASQQMSEARFLMKCLPSGIDGSLSMAISFFGLRDDQSVRRIDICPSFSGVSHDMSIKKSAGLCGGVVKDQSRYDQGKEGSS